MSFSDKFPNWQLFKERAVPLEIELLAPAAEVAGLLQRQMSALKTAQQAEAEAHAAAVKTLVQQANLVYQLAETLKRNEAALKEAGQEKAYRALRIQKDQMIEGLQKAGLTVETPLGKPFDGVADLVIVQGWRHHADFSAEVVAEVREPIVYHNDMLVQQALVVMGAPLVDETAQ